MSGERLCEYCDAPAAWVCYPEDGGYRRPVGLCDDHAADIDLDELESLHPLDQVKP